MDVAVIEFIANLLDDFSLVLVFKGKPEFSVVPVVVPIFRMIRFYIDLVFLIRSMIVVLLEYIFELDGSYLCLFLRARIGFANFSDEFAYKRVHF